MKQVVQVTILGQQYSVKSEAAAEEVRRVAEFVNEKISEVVAANKTVDTLNTAVLALLNVSGAYIRLRERVGDQKELEGRLRQLLDRLENSCPELG
ncbi:MAG: cell division protein ZapA [Desulfuromonadales bacterium]